MHLKNLHKISWKAGFVLVILLGLGVLSLSGRNTPAMGAGDWFYQLNQQGTLRTYILHLPPAAAKGKVALIVALHGVTPSITNFRRQSNLDAEADQDGFAVLYPMGIRSLGLLTWNAGACCGWAQWRGIDDVGFILQALDRTIAEAPIDRSRVYLTGLSNGAMMAYRLAAVAPERFAAMAAVAGTLNAEPKPHSRPMPILHIHSVDDPLLPYQGRWTLLRRFPGVEEMLKPWLKVDGCPLQAQITQRLEQNSQQYGHSTAIRKTWAPCQGDVQVIAWQLIGPGHVWPGGNPPFYLHWLTHGPTRIINANTEIWHFFSSYRLSQPAAVNTKAKPVDPAG